MTLYRDPSQEQKIYELLRQRGPAWTPAPELSQISLQYCRAISCLRKRGIAIENKVEIVRGVRHGYYRLALRNGVTQSLRQDLTQSEPQSGLFTPVELSRVAKWIDEG